MSIASCGVDKYPIYRRHLLEEICCISLVDSDFLQTQLRKVMFSQLAKRFLLLYISNAFKGFGHERTIHSQTASQVGQCLVFCGIISYDFLLIACCNFGRALLHREMNRIQNLITSSPRWYFMGGNLPSGNLRDSFRHVNVRIALGL